MQFDYLMISILALYVILGFETVLVLAAALYSYVRKWKTIEISTKFPFKIHLCSYVHRRTLLR